MRMMETAPSSRSLIATQRNAGNPTMKATVPLPHYLRERERCRTPALLGMPVSGRAGKASPDRHRGVLGVPAVLWVVVVLLRSAALADITVHATVNTTQAQVGESIALTVSIEGAQDVPAPQIRVSGLDARYVGPSTQISMVNGRVTSSVQHRYTLAAPQAGRFEIGPITVTYDGNHYPTTPIGVEFVAAGAAPATGQGPGGGARKGGLFATLSTPKTEVYLHESLAIDIDLYVGAVRASDLQFPTLSTDGISVDQFPQPTQRQQVIDGQSYQVVHFHTNAVALRSGTLSLGPATVRLTVQERSSRRGSFGDPFFDDFFQQGHQVDVHSDPVTINVLPLPEAGRPADFSGAVGSFTMDVKAAPTELAAGDPITVRLDISGNGNLSDAAAPVLTKSEGFRIYDARTTKTDVGLRSYEQVVIPMAATTSLLAPFRFSYFDPRTARYNVIESQPVALQVRPPQQAPHTEIVSADGGARRSAPEEKLGRDIVFIKDDPASLVPRSSRTSVLWLLLASLPIPPLLFAAIAWYDEHRRRLSGDERYARFTRAGKEARRGLAKAQQALAQGNRSELYEAVATTMREYLSAKLGLPAGAIDADAVSRCGLDADCVEQLRRFFATCEQERFAPAAGNVDMRGTLVLAEEILARIERQRRGKLRPTRLLALLALLAAVCAAVAASAAASEPAGPQTTFFHANSLYKDGNYSGAAKEYEQLLQLGLESSALYFNLGNAYFKAGDRGKAMLQYERARRLRPNDPDVEANLAFAQSLNGVEACTAPLWQKFVFPLAGRGSTATLLGLAAVAYAAVFLLLGLQRLLPQAPRWLAYAAAAAVAVAIVAGASGAQQAYVDQWQVHAVVTAEGESSARFEPADNGTVHFSLKQGTVVQVLDRREGWLQIARCDGLRGWLPRSAAAEF